MDDQHRLVDRAGTPACRWRPQKGGSPTSAATPGAEDGEAIGRSRGGLSTKIHLAVDGRGRPLSILLTPGQAGDNPQLLALLDAIRVNEPRPGRPRKRPDVLIADQAIYKKRNVAKRCFNRLKQWRDLATRYAKRASLYRASLVLIAAVIWLP